MTALGLHAPVHGATALPSEQPLHGRGQRSTAAHRRAQHGGAGRGEQRRAGGGGGGTGGPAGRARGGQGRLPLPQPRLGGGGARARGGGARPAAERCRGAWPWRRPRPGPRLGVPRRGRWSATTACCGPPRCWRPPPPVSPRGAGTGRGDRFPEGLRVPGGGGAQPRGAARCPAGSGLGAPRGLRGEPGLSPPLAPPPAARVYLWSCAHVLNGDRLNAAGTIPGGHRAEPTGGNFSRTESVSSAAGCGRSAAGAEVRLSGKAPVGSAQADTEGSGLFSSVGRITGVEWLRSL